jgi:probable F420-dependent oxidoreductase
VTQFRVGAFFPHDEIGAHAVEIRDFAQAIEAMGYTYLATADHVVGANRASRPDWKGAYDSTTRIYEPLVLFSYLAGVTETLEFMTAVIIAPQRQTALIAKQAANLDLFCGGRLRIGLGTGWNPVEYEALAMRWADRGARLDDQIRVLRRFWSEDNITEHSSYHHLNDVGLAPMPRQRPIPIWIGGTAAPAMRRAAQLGDGWMPYLSADGAAAKLTAY